MVTMSGHQPSLHHCVIRECRYGDGERVPQLVDAAGVPDARVSAYVTTWLRPQGRAYATMENHVRGIARGVAFIAESRIDIDRRLATTGMIFDRLELDKLARACEERLDGKGRIGAAVAGSYFTAFMDYLYWLQEPFQQRADKQTRSLLVDERRRFDRLVKERCPRETGPAANSSIRKGLTPAQRELFLKVIHPNHPQNPFTPKLRIRNYAILMLAYFLGPRAGETLSLKRPQFDDRSADRTVTIERRPFDAEDPRSEPALVKTLGRTIPLMDQVADSLAAWMRHRDGQTKGRANFPASARRTGFIFISTGGIPLSGRRLRDIYATLGTAFPELSNLTQHVLRADDSERWVELDKAENRDKVESHRAHREKKGWSQKSKMIEHYAGFMLSQQSQAFIRRSNDRLMAGKR
jgi:integrase